MVGPTRGGVFRNETLMAWYCQKVLVSRRLCEAEIIET